LGARVDLEQIRNRGACHGSDTKMFFPERGQTVPAEAQAKCDRCTVALECLLWATQHREEGFWGGTSDRVRRVMRRARVRAACPVCTSTDLRNEPGHQLCTSCGMSWKTPKEKPKPVDKPAVVPSSAPIALAA
jgi:ribosomal protein L37AE/L43A